MTARLLADSTTPDQMPTWVHMQAFYIDGKFAASPARIAQWRGPKVLINVTGDPASGGDMLDVENGDATPDHIPAWYDARLASGVRRPGVYSDRVQFAACTAALGPRRAARWLATLDGTLLHTFDGHALDACQLLGAQAVGANYDLSVVFNPSWHPGSDVAIPPSEAAELAHLAAITTQDLAALSAAIRKL